ncbi:chitinase [Kitasatospora sp. NPDC056327]|uniref:chitinase n=1 Tax=Kitasatospora sp. NPDC056327 TaxID=3345785 RepID=UPI0035D99435
MLRTRAKALLAGLLAAGALAASALVPTTAAAATPIPVDECAIAPAWSQGANYQTRDIVLHTDGKIYVARRDNPGYNPAVSTYYWAPYTCGTGGNPYPGSFVVSEAQFNQMFPNRNPAYTYQGLVAAMAAFPAFAHTGDATMRRQEAAAFLANISHETAGLYYIKEVNEANYPHYCDAARSFGCPAGQAAYYGRGPMQLSWNYNYKLVGDYLGIDLLNNPWLVENDPAVAMMTALWYWNTQSGPGPITGHDAMISGAGFGQSIRSINGALECDGKNPRQVESRVNRYKAFTQLLGVPTGSSVPC